MTFFFPGPHGRLEGDLWLPRSDSDPTVCAVMAHPSPSEGGTMNTTALFRAARGLQDAGLAVMRFNFRGVRRSQGEVEAGPGAIEDLRAALSELERRFPRAELWVGGYSFGARTAAALAAGLEYDEDTKELREGNEGRVRRVVLIALPVEAFDCSVVTQVKVPGLVVQAGADAFGDLGALRDRFPDLDGLDLEEIPSTDHFFRGESRELQRRVAEYASRHISVNP